MPMVRRPVDEQAAFDRLGKEIRRARGARTQGWLAEAIDVDQTSLSGYELGKGRIPLIKLLRLEEACDLPAGELLKRARIISPTPADDQPATLSAIMADPDLDEDGREVVSHVYDYCRREAESADRAGQPTPAEDHAAWLRRLGRPPTEADVRARARALEGLDETVS